MGGEGISTHLRRFGLPVGLFLVLGWMLPSGGQAAGPPPLRVIVELDTGGPLSRSDRVGASGDSAERRDRIRDARSELERRMRGSGARVLRRYESLPMVALEVPHEALLLLATSDEVSVIEGDRLFKMSLAQSAPQIQATDVHDVGYDGTGWHIAVLDTGIDAQHPMLAGRVDEEACFSGTGDCPGGATQAFGAGAAAPCGLPGCFHGTHVAGIAAGEDEVYRGVAPGAGLIAVQVFSTLSGDLCPGGGDCVLAYISDIIRGLDYVYQLRDTYQIAAANLSLGGGEYTSAVECDTDSGMLLFTIAQLRSAGIATIVASGNDGYINAMSSPACLTPAVSVGSVTKQGAVSSFSNSAGFLDFLAPGSAIVSAVPGQGLGIASGTSMATPHVSGAWALCQQREGGASVDQVLSDLQSTGLPVLDTGNGLEHPLLQLQVNFVPEPGGALSVLAVACSLLHLRRSRARPPRPAARAPSCL